MQDRDASSRFAINYVIPFSVIKLFAAPRKCQIDGGTKDIFLAVSAFNDRRRIVKTRFRFENSPVSFDVGGGRRDDDFRNRSHAAHLNFSNSVAFHFPNGRSYCPPFLSLSPSFSSYLFPVRCRPLSSVSRGRHAGETLPFFPSSLHVASRARRTSRWRTSGKFRKVVSPRKASSLCPPPPENHSQFTATTRTTDDRLFSSWNLSGKCKCERNRKIGGWEWRLELKINSRAWC